jgi:4-hydroxy-tetrahydrodipicolinate reductase
MKIGLLGYGRMGKAIEKIALERGHEIVYKIDKDYNNGNLIKADVAINFSIPSAAVNNVITALENSIPVICGTTGWLDQYKKVTKIALHNKTAFLYASNFSIGVNLFFKLNKTLAKIVQNQDYKASVEEIHHIHKLDAPSGTAITLAEGIIENSNLKKWCKQDAGEDELEIKSIREGEVPGIHTIQYKSDIDSITIRHEAFDRKGFAYGALIAAEWIVGKKGIFKMDDVLNF